MRQDRAAGREAQLKQQLGRLDADSVDAVAAADHAPVVQFEVGYARFCISEPETFARAALGVHQVAERGVGQRGVRHDQLLRRERARVAIVGAGAAAEKRDLETERLAVGGIEPASDIPPFGLELRMGAVVRWEAERAARQHRGEGGLRGLAALGEQKKEGENEAHYQSSLTARIGPPDSA